MDLHLVIRVPDPPGEGEASACSIDDVSYLSCARGAYKNYDESIKPPVSLCLIFVLSDMGVCLSDPVFVSPSSTYRRNSRAKSEPFSKFFQKTCQNGVHCL